MCIDILGLKEEFSFWQQMKKKTRKTDILNGKLCPETQTMLTIRDT